MRQPGDRGGRSGRVRHRPDRPLRLLRRHLAHLALRRGPASNAQIELYRLAREQIAYNLALVRPGLGLREFSEKAFRLPERYRANRYSTIAHGVGLCDEYPAIYYPEDAEATGYDGVLEAGMTICLESYIGEEGGAEGVKLEEQVLVTETGAEVLSRYPFEDDVFG